MNLTLIPLSHLHPHPANSNVMPAELFGKLVEHLARTDRYPPVIVRAWPGVPRSEFTLQRVRAEAGDAQPAGEATGNGASHAGHAEAWTPNPEHAEAWTPNEAHADAAAAPEEYQILDGHHRVRALRELGRAAARCVVWDVDDAEALVLLATLNRLQGRDDPGKRAALVGRLAGLPGMELGALARRLPETVAGLGKLAALRFPAAPPRPPVDMTQMPRAVHFFLLPEQRQRLEAALARVGGSREEALLRLVGGGE